MGTLGTRQEISLLCVSGLKWYRIAPMAWSGVGFSAFNGLDDLRLVECRRRDCLTLIELPCVMSSRRAKADYIVTKIYWLERCVQGTDRHFIVLCVSSTLADEVKTELVWLTAECE